MEELSVYGLCEHLKIEINFVEETLAVECSYYGKSSRCHRDVCPAERNEKNDKCVVAIRKEFSDVPE